MELINEFKNDAVHMKTFDVNEGYTINVTYTEKGMSHIYFSEKNNSTFLPKITYTPNDEGNNFLFSFSEVSFFDDEIGKIIEAIRIALDAANEVKTFLGR